VVAKLARWARQVGERALRLHRLNIGPRLRLCFILIVLAMLLGNAVLLSQFYQARVQAERLTGVDEELIVVLQAHTNLMAFYERLEALADSENTPELVKEAGLLRQDLLENGGRISSALSRLPPEVQLDPTLMPTLQVLQDALPAELQAITDLAKAKDWQAVRLRLANQVRPLESRTSALVASIDREVAEKRTQALLEIGHAERRILVIVPAAAILTLLFASFLGLAITRSITLPLGRLMEGSHALAKGDFSHRVPATGDDEIALLGTVFNDMVVRLQQLYRELQRREAYLAEAQKLSHTGSFGWEVSTGKIYWSEETFRIFDYDPGTSPTIDLVIARIHPEDQSLIVQAIQRAEAERSGFDFEHRLILSDGSVKYVHALAHSSASDEPGGLLFVGAITDITESKLAQEALHQSGELLTAQRAQLDELFERAPEGIVLLDIEDRVLRINSEFARIFGYTREEAIGHTMSELIVPEDLRKEAQAYTERITHGRSVNAETIRRRKDGSRVHVSLLAVPISVPGGQIAEYAIYRDLTQDKIVEGELTRQRAHLEQLFETVPQGLALVDLKDRVVRVNPEFSRIFGYSADEVVGRLLNDLIAPGELRAEADEFSKLVTGRGQMLNVETVRGRKDGSRVPVSAVSVPISIAGSQVGEYAIYRDITQRKRAEEALRQSEAYLTEAQTLTHTASWVWRVDSRNPVHLSEEWYRIFGFDPKDGMPGWEARLQRVHPEDRARWRETIERAIREKSEYDMEFRIVLRDGTVKWVHSVSHPETNILGELVQFVGSSLDITERKLAEQTLRRSEGYLADAQRMTRCGSWAWDVRTDAIFWSQEFYRIYECDPEKVKPSWSYILERVHPEDRPGVEQRAKLESTQKDTVASEGDFRIVFPDGRIKHLHSIAHPVIDESGEITEVVGTTMDVTEQYEARVALEIAFEQIKELRDQLYKENIALREEVDKVSMFEEIVGSSEPLRHVLTQVAKVAATDSTVLILGETGTGKEMIARAIHRRSKRANRAFIRVNCAAIPPTLIASELFGHEKGAFTGASQRRLGRFELADGGTLFLDEVGELPAETQSALLRVIQEREFERVGGTQTVSADVRVLSATNRNLRAAVEAGTFRQDLFYRLNVFPIQMPSLRERADDIPLLVEYLIDRYAKKAGKRIRNIDKKTLALFQEYSWPGNIRELQNVVERAVILCDSETFSVDSTWLKRELPPTPSPLSPPPRGIGRLDETKEKELIEAALSQTAGRVSGPAGAAALLGVPRQTLESKIANLGINKHRFKSA
jgi:PAS domain S-box-containing protein